MSIFSHFDISAWIWAKLAQIHPKRHFQHENMLFFLLAMLFMTYIFAWELAQIKISRYTYAFNKFIIITIIIHLLGFSIFSIFCISFFLLFLSTEETCFQKTALFSTPLQNWKLPLQYRIYFTNGKIAFIPFIQRSEWEKNIFRFV